LKLSQRQRTRHWNCVFMRGPNNGPTILFSFHISSMGNALKSNISKCNFNTYPLMHKTDLSAHWYVIANTNTKFYVNSEYIFLQNLFFKLIEWDRHKKSPFRQWQNLNRFVQNTENYIKISIKIANTYLYDKNALFHFLKYL